MASSNKKNKKQPEQDVNQKELNRKLAEKKQIEETILELSTNEKYKEFFDNYHAESVPEFIKDYAHHKAQLLYVGQIYINNEEERAVQFRKSAEPMLIMILQKKLFNLKCLWRAGKIELEGVESIYDFWAWERDIFRCPFIEPITREEWNLWKKAMAAHHVEDPGPTMDQDNMFAMMMFRWQGYDDFKKYYNKTGENPLPDWYKYYDLNMGTADLFHLEDLKGPRENELTTIGHDAQHPEQRVLEKHPEIEVPPEVKRKYDEPVPPPVKAAPQVPWLSHDDITIYNFMLEFEGENEELLELADYVIEGQRVRRESDTDIDIHDSIDFLLHLDEPVRMEACWDWREALMVTIDNYKEEQILGVSNDVFEDYLMRIENNIPLHVDKQYLTYAKMFKGFADGFKEKVLMGRKVLGEPEDFSFNKIKKQ